jgi:hypothetical protein
VRFEYRKRVSGPASVGRGRAGRFDRDFWIFHLRIGFDRRNRGGRKRNQVVSTDYGPLRLAAIEDIIWKRVVEARSWNRPEALDEAMLAVRRYASRIDWDYVERKGRVNGVLDLICDLRRMGESDGEDGQELTGR